MEYAPIIGIVALLLLHIFRSPKEQFGDFRDQVDGIQKSHNTLRDSHDALRLQIAGQHLTKTEVQDMFSKVNESVKEIRIIAEGLRVMVEGLKNGQARSIHP